MFQDQKFTDAEIAFIAALKEDSGMGWPEITDKFNKKFKNDKSSNAVRKGYERARDRISGGNGEYVRLFRSVATTKKNNSLNSKDLRNVLKAWDEREDILEAIKGAASDVNKVKVPPRTKSSKGKPCMTMELLISDVHVGKLTDTFNHDVLKRRLMQLSSTMIKEMHKNSLTSKIDRVILAFLGDLIESSTMHGTESAKGCEFGNSRQVQECLVHLFNLVVVPISQAAAQYGATVDCVGVAGNHDRTEHDRTYNRVGEENVTWIIYNSMKEFTKLAGLKDVSWHIPVDPYIRLEIYGEGVLFEHYDNAKGNTRAALENLLAKRVNQLKKPIRFMRGGHFHEPTEYGVGKIIINGNVPGNDGYSTSHGFDCEPTQTLNFYIEREKGDSVKRETSFYKRMLIQLN
jgi:hypothetical protein